MRMNQVPLSYSSATYAFNFEHPLSIANKATNLTEITPAKKITFYKSGDPQLTGVKMTVNKRTFKTFDALLDDLAQKISLPFAVRTVTTPHGVHNINSLEQLEDGGSYICSHKKYVKPINMDITGRKPATWQGNNPRGTHQHATKGGKQEAGGVHHTQMGHKNIILIKNGNVDIHYSIVLHKKNTHNFRSFLEEISELMQYNVRKLYTMDGKNVDTLQALFHCPGVLVCVGHEALKPIVYEKFRRLSEKLPDLSRRSHIDNQSIDMKTNVNFGLEAKKSVIHPRSPSRSSRHSLSPDKSCTNGLPSSNSGHASVVNSLPHKKGELNDSMIDDDIEKKVRVNKDGSLSVEMKVRFRLLNRETLQWSTQIRRSSLRRKSSNELLCATEQVEEINANNDFDESFHPSNTDDFYASKRNGAEPEESHCENCCKCGQGYDIWKNPMYDSQIREENLIKSTATHSSLSSSSPYHEIIYQSKSTESIQTISSEEYSKHLLQQVKNELKTMENGNRGVEYCSVSHCSSQTGSCTFDSKTEGYCKGRTSISRNHSASSHRVSSCFSTNISHQNSHDGPISCISPNSSTVSAKRKVAVKNIDVSENVDPATSCTNSEEASIDLEEVDSRAAADRNENNVSEAFHCLKCNKNTEGQDNTEGRDQNVSSRCSKHSVDDCKESTTLNHLCSNIALNCSSEFNGKVKTMRNAGYAEGVKVVSNGSLHNDKNTNGEICKDNKSDNDISLYAGKSKTDLNISERQSFSEIQGTSHKLHIQNNGTHGISVSNTNYSSSKRSNEYSKNMNTDEAHSNSVLSWSSTSSTGQKKSPSLTSDKDSNASCSENLSELNEVKPKYQPTVSTHSKQSSLSNHAEIIQTDTINKNKISSNSDSLNPCSSSSTSWSKRAKSENECRPSTSVSNNSIPDLEPGVEGKTNNEEKITILYSSGFSEVLQLETNTKMEHERCETACSNPSILSKASRENTAAENQKQNHIENELHQTDISKLSKVTEVECFSCKVDDVKITETTSVIESASVENMPLSFAQRGNVCGKTTKQILLDPALKTKSSTTIDKVSSQKPPSSGLTTSTSNPSEKSTANKSHKVNSDSDRNSAEVNSNGKCKDENNKKKNKNKNSTRPTALSYEKHGLIPTVLPNASFEDIVHEWLKKIPSEKMLMKYDNTEEFQEKCEKSAIEVIPEEPKSDTEAITILEEKPYGLETTVNDQKSKEKNDQKSKEINDLTMVWLENMASQVSEGKSSSQEMVKELDILQSKPMSFSCSVPDTSNQLHENILLYNMHSPVETIKVLLSSRQRIKLERSSSLPSLNRTFERNLSHSAKSLLRCLASLQFFDKESSNHKNKLNDTNNSAQKELLSILKPLWFTDIMKECEGKFSQTAEKHAKTFKGHTSADDNITPLSSSGVDINSGSGGSGDGSMGGAIDVSQVIEKKKCDLYLNAHTNKKNDVTNQNQLSLMKNSVDETSEICNKQNDKTKEYSISSVDSTKTNASCKKPKLRKSRNAKTKSEDNNNIEERSLSRNSRLSHSDVAPSSPVTPDIACRVQWNSGEQSDNGEDLDENICNNSRQSPEDTNQDTKKQPASPIEGMEPSAGASCDLEKNVHLTKAQDHNENVDEDTSEEEQHVHEKIIEKCENAGIIKSSQQIIHHHCGTQAVIDQEPEPTQRKSFNPDPAWLQKLLKKMEKQFITDYMDAMNEFKIKWNLEVDDRLDQMIEELREDVSKRIRGSIERELRKVQCRAGQIKPSPPNEPRRCESSEQTEQRYKRLKAMHKMQMFSPQSKEAEQQCSTKDISSLISDEVLTFGEMLGDNTDADEQFNIDKFCPCDSCSEKNKAAKCATNPMHTSIPVIKYFDLREILRIKMNKQVKEHITDTDWSEQLLDRELSKHDCAESESMQHVQNKTEHAIQHVEPMPMNQENVVLNNECQNHNLDTTLDQAEEKVRSGNHVVGLKLKENDQRSKQIDKCTRDIECKSEGGGDSLNIVSGGILECSEDQVSDVYKYENEHKNDKENSEFIVYETDYTEYNNEIASTATVQSGEQEVENNMSSNNSEPEVKNNRLEESHSIDSQHEYKMSETDIKDIVENLDNDVSESSDEFVKSNVIKNPNERVLVIMNSKVPLEQSDSLAVINCPQHSGTGVPEDSVKEDNVSDNILAYTKEATSSSSNSPGNKSSHQMYLESSSDEDRKSICTSPEASEDEKDSDNTSDLVADQNACLRNSSKKLVNNEFNDDDLDF
ncbi:retinitis pigmentosa 1-like 1 protein [Chiloscyllium plagiosum]|uniref:retinitis pigmentosa 1-like 1 protein n=1 Tax=Chiloscyllium plagiosum TaxID=36176 RepID=UPI001CB7C80A|nr:retinitis pigmentosa 1-like 1 protein [Chiloscyllium plagiosum]XP_043538279.1 retinitis pigmentosa 1-like 1 protein [Chiloscyllium plagiosum]XP_043538287.1 retinitis pigmentosa 1-like 1 protein [Chiloscyllium plagiosum]